MPFPALSAETEASPTPRHTHTHTHPWPFTSVGPVFSLGYECVLNGFQLLMTHVDWGPPGSSVHGIFQARILAGVGCHFLLQGIFPTQESNPGLLHCRQTLYRLSHQGRKKGNAKECSNYHTITFISHTSKVMLKILQVRLQQYLNRELPYVQAGFKKAEKPEIKLPTSAGS